MKLDGNKPFIAILSLVISFIGASIAPIVAYLNNQNELELEKVRNTQSIRMDYLKRATDPAKEPEYFRRVLRFMRDVPDDKKVREWADGELQRVEAAVKKLEKEKEEAEKKAEEYRLEKEQAERHAHDIANDLELVLDEKEKYSKEIDAAKRKISKLLRERTQKGYNHLRPATHNCSVKLLYMESTKEEGAPLYTFMSLDEGPEFIIGDSLTYEACVINGPPACNDHFGIKSEGGGVKIVAKECEVYWGNTLVYKRSVE